MNDLPRQTLTRIIAEHGRGICDAPKRVEGLLRDLCGAFRREINIIIGALEERVAADLLTAGRTVPRDVLLARLTARLRDNLAYTPEAARWGVETWALALGIISEAELRERARAEAAESAERDATRPAQDAEPTATKPARHTPTTSQPPRGTTHAPTPARQPTPSPKASPPPTIVTPPAAAPRRMPTTRPHAPVMQLPQQNVAPAPPARDASRRGLKLRGCLIVVMLIIVLIVAAVFVVPAVIMLLKEEQAQPSINEPRIR
ncbi:MAG TPA: hypothetical protein VK363_13745 [Pyrinomonadaceae bacterium]|nr:hypothetical protein [Pyrinomonadaceae bacterium]